jgi:bacterioferritin
MEEFLTDVKTLRAQARENMDKGPVTDAYGADLERVLHVLNQALATELVCMLRYKRHYYTAKGINAQPAADEFLQHAAEEAGHADLIAAHFAIGRRSRFQSQYVDQAQPFRIRCVQGT